ncbi:MAG: hypothetical protein IIZ09_05885, partial [Ruminococcus sp.]|nr:hypothetical protein [Ruminococcus sp.]
KYPSEEPKGVKAGDGVFAETSEDKKYPSEEPKGKIKAGDGVFAATLEDKKIPTLPKCVKSGFLVSW